MWLRNNTFYSEKGGFVYDECISKKATNKTIGELLTLQ